MNSSSHFVSEWGVLVLGSGSQPGGQDTCKGSQDKSKNDHFYYTFCYAKL